MSTNLNQWIVGAKNGRRLDQRALYEHFARLVYGLCLRYAGNTEEAYDFAQEVWLGIFAKIHLYEETGPFEGWLRRVTVNRCISLLRKRGIRTTEMPEVLPQGAWYSPEIHAQLAAEELLHLIGQLPDGYRLVFNLVAIEGFSHAEAAEMLGISESASRSQLTRARHLLQKRLTNQSPYAHVTR